MKLKVAVTVTALPDRQTRESPPEVVPVSGEGESSGTNPVPAQVRSGRSTEPKKWPRAITLLLRTLLGTSACSAGTCNVVLSEPSLA